MRGGLAVVDYAHKPEALAAVLDALRPFATGKLICVMGCGGDRDKGKRPIMGSIAVDKVGRRHRHGRQPAYREAGSHPRRNSLAAPGAQEIGDRAEAIAAGVAMLGPVSCPLPATSSTSPWPAGAPARIASARSPISRAPGAPPRISARMASGFSLRGLSSVTMTSRDCRRRCPHDRPLALVAVAAAAEHAHEPAGGERAQRLERGGQRVGLVRVVDDDEAAAHLADDLEPALDALQARSAGRTRPAGSPAAMARPAASSAFEPGIRRAAAAGCRNTRPSCAHRRRWAKPSRASARASGPRRRGRPSGRGARRLARAAITAGACSASALTTAVPSAGSSSENSRSLAAR